MKILNFLIAGLLAFFPTSISVAMPGIQHNRGASLLRGTAMERGGVGKMSMERIASVTKWMDNPVFKIGQYNLSGTGRPISPWNHNEIRHNPLKVARVFSGTGVIDKAVLNVARLHKIQDMAVNKRPIDGWKITKSRQAKANDILKFVERNGRLPKSLPRWVDASGIETKAGLSRVSRLIRPMPDPYPYPPRPYPGPAVVTNGLAVAANAAIATGGLVFVFDTGLELISYSQGKITHGDLKDGIEKAGIRAGSVGAATGTVIYLCSSTPHGLVLVGVGVAVYIGTDYAIATWTDNWGTTSLDLTELQGILPTEVANEPMLASLFLN